MTSSRSEEEIDRAGVSRVLRLLSTTFLKNIETVENQELITVKSTDDLNTAFNTLITNKIHGAPVVDPVTGECKGLIDLKDFVAYVLFLYGQSKGGEYCAAVDNLVNFSHENPFVPISEDSSLDEALKLFISERLHRVPIVSKENPKKVTRMISHFTLLSWILLNKASLEEELSLSLSFLEEGAIKPVISVTEETRLLDAFDLIVKNKVTGLAVVDSKTGKLVASLSCTDLQYSVEEHVELLEGTVNDFLEKGRKKIEPIACDKEAKVIDVLQILVENHIHRVFVVDGEFKPIGVLTATDVMDVLISVAMAEYFKELMI